MYFSTILFTSLVSLLFHSTISAAVVPAAMSPITFPSSTIPISPPVQILPRVSSDIEDQYGEALQAIFGMGVRLQVLLQDTRAAQTENFIVSPLSACLLLGQLMLGSQGQFQQYLYEILTLPYNNNDNDNNYTLVYKSKSGNATVESYELRYGKLHLQLGSLVKAFQDSRGNFTLSTASALFYSQQLSLLPLFRKNMAIYNAELTAVRFDGSRQSLELLNSWADKNTAGVIKQLVSVPPAVTTSAIFANALHFKAQWETPFSTELNVDGPFITSPNSTVGVTYMLNQFEEIPYAESKELDCKMIGLPYRNRELTMYMVLPNKNHRNEYNIREFARQLKTADVLGLLSNMKDLEVSVKIPKLFLSTSISILEPLQQYAAYKKHVKQQSRRNRKGRNQGISVLDKLGGKIDDFESFVRSANGSKVEDPLTLNNAVRDGRLVVSNIVQQMTFAVDENGTEAAAITSSTLEYMSTKTFLANKPFMFFIRHEATTATIFWGTIVNPASRN